ncbi:hypothetical protein FHX57_007592 [Paraburkholderia tropica]|uniref:Abortive infection Abi-like protein n=1 Tax=Paraburkholderia tropica TaxID=92647 RepID=A0ABX5MEL4_9BURK|nr:hypothetical protein [Paraburkholderia tropica]MBB3005204.1 hypothetical protein [Paraburkholderia tropica]MBB6324126.1 hypothetical protein [Paraburkholderia tropica]PXX07865.1 abortive infection Abi-like protein [Paraburkholderia tropica]PZW73285.1 abortive infection Abi-like protein [Paraburkholderia tropica]
MILLAALLNPASTPGQRHGADRQRRFGSSGRLDLEHFGPDDTAYGHLSYLGSQLVVAYRTTEHDLEDAHNHDDPHYRIRSLTDVPKRWLEPLLTEETLDWLLQNIADVLDAQEKQVDRSRDAVDAIVAAESAKLDEQLDCALTASGSPTLQENWAATVDALHLHPGDGTTRASSFVEAVCAEILRERGVPLPANESMKPLIETVLANLAWPDDVQLQENVKRLKSGVSTVCQAVGALRTHSGSAHGTSTHLPPLDPTFATLAKNAGVAVAIFLLARHRDRCCRTRASASRNVAAPPSNSVRMSSHSADALPTIRR